MDLLTLLALTHRLVLQKLQGVSPPTRFPSPGEFERFESSTPVSGWELQLGLSNSLLPVVLLGRERQIDTSLRWIPATELLDKHKVLNL